MELQKMFYSPIAWLVLIIFGIQSSVQYIDIIIFGIKQAEMFGGMPTITNNLFTGQIGFFSVIQDTLYLYIPLITMGLMSKEFSSGSIKLLYSSPVSNTQIVLGKYFAAVTFCVVMIVILFAESIFSFVVIKDFDFLQVLTGLLGMFLVIATYSAIGLFMSSLTSYQIAAAIGSFTTLFILQKVGDMWQTIHFVRDITYWLSISGRSNTFISGLVCSEDVLYFILVSGLFIVFTIFRLKGIREKSPKYISIIRYTGAFMAFVMIGYVSTIPSLMKYYDATRTDLNSLTKNSQDVISKLKGKVKITTYVNVFNDNYYFGLPDVQKGDEETFEKYRRFYPNIEFVFKYYHDTPIQEQMLKNYNTTYRGLSTVQALDKFCNLYDMNIKDIKPSKVYNNEIDLKSELNRFVRKIETEDGKVSYLRMYDDNEKYASESQVTAAFKKLTDNLPLVGFVEGHGERDLEDFGSRGYNMLTKERTFRWSLLNNGFDFNSCVLSKPIDGKINILVIADAKTAFSVQEMKNLNDYIDRGGNLVIACDLKRQNNLNPLVSRFGVEFLPGQVVEYNKGYGLDLITSVFTKEGQKLAYQFENIGEDNIVTMPGAVAISYKRGNEFKYTSVLVSDAVNSLQKTDPVGSWNELKTTDFIDDVAKYNPQERETSGPFTTALALTRKVGKKNQKIMILGDADCLSNAELSSNRASINAKNFEMANGMFFWLTDYVSPIDIRRPYSPDDKMLLKKEDMGFYTILYKIIFPSLFALAFLLIWLRRKGR